MMGGSGAGAAFHGAGGVLGCRLLASQGETEPDTVVREASPPA
jgi:hypothetical protein